MGDPLSVAASLAGLVSLGLQSTEYLVNFYRVCRHRGDDLARTTNKLEALLQALRILNESIQQRKWSVEERNIVEAIETSVSNSETVIRELQEEVQKFDKDPTAGFWKTFTVSGRRAAYPFRKSTLEKLAEDVDDFQHNLSTALQILQVKDHQMTQTDIVEIRNAINIVQEQNAATGVRDWLRAPDATIDYNSACTKRYAGTGQWFVQSTAFRAWLEQGNSCLWLHGFAGCGKTVLCSTAIQHTVRHVHSQRGYVIGFFFFTFQDESKQDASAFLRTLLIQLSGQLPSLWGVLARLKSSSNGRTTSVLTLLDCMRQAILRSRHVYLLLDGLDESPLEGGRADVLSAIQTMRDWSLPGLHLLITSRDIFDIRHSLDVDSENAVEIKNDGVDDDISHYISYRVEHDPQLRRLGKHCEMIKEHLSEKAGGVFRWVECQLGPLRRCPHSLKHLQRCLNSLPPTLDETYQRMLCNIGGESADEARSILTFLCFSIRPLSVAELIDAIAVNLDAECFDPDLKVVGADDLLRICPGLIDIYADQSEGAGNMVGAELCRTFTNQYSLPDIPVPRGFLRQSLTPELLEEYAFAKFAAREWYEHYRLCRAESQTAFGVWSLRLFTNPLAFTRWLRISDPDISWNGVTFDDNEVVYASPVYYAALLGIEIILPSLLSESPDANAQGGRFGNPLQAASAHGNGNIVQMLLDAGADVNIKGGAFGSALQAASYGNYDHAYDHVVQMLLDAGAEVNASGGYYGDALYAASDNGHEKVVQRLLNAGADINTRSGMFGSPLQAASFGGYEKVVQMLLDAGAEVNTRGGDMGTALQAASFRGRKKVVQMLLNAGADVHAERTVYGDAVAMAGSEGHIEVRWMLLQHIWQNEKSSRGQV